MATRTKVSGDLSVALPRAEAVGLFTPEGERAWVPDWDPTYPGGEASEETGTVFLSHVGGVETIWIILGIDRESGETSFARITPGHHAGTVRVHCRADGDDATIATVSYDISILPGARSDAIDAYAPEGFAEMLDQWRVFIDLYLARAGRAG